MANKIEEIKKPVIHKDIQPGGLLVNRVPLSEWNCKPMEANYEIVTQVGCGSFR